MGGVESNSYSRTRIALLLRPFPSEIPTECPVCAVRSLCSALSDQECSAHSFLVILCHGSQTFFYAGDNLVFSERVKDIFMHISGALSLFLYNLFLSGTWCTNFSHLRNPKLQSLPHQLGEIIVLCLSYPFLHHSAEGVSR